MTDRPATSTLVRALIDAIVADEVHPVDAKALELAAYMYAGIDGDLPASELERTRQRRVMELPAKQTQEYYEGIAQRLAGTGIRISLAVVDDHRYNIERRRGVFAHLGSDADMLAVLCDNDGNWSGKVLKCYSGEVA